MLVTGTRIGDRAQPLAPKTREGILTGLRRYGWAPREGRAAGGFLVQPAHGGRRPHGLDTLPEDLRRSGRLLGLGRLRTHRLWNHGARRDASGRVRAPSEAAGVEGLDSPVDSRSCPWVRP
jgi:hypothetical protein